MWDVSTEKMLESEGRLGLRGHCLILRKILGLAEPQDA